MSPKGVRATTSGLGARYGWSVRRRIARAEAASRGKYPCPKCGAVSVKRVSVGVWSCSKCGNTFAGGAYSPTTKVGEVARRSVK
jgi:large subunit ribosomal protein L37Ae